MNRMDEFKALQQELSETPPELTDTIARAKQRAKQRTWIHHMIGMPLSSLAACFMVFVLLVNFCTPFASACSNIPALKALAEAVTFNPSLQQTLEHDYHQDIGISKTIGDITVSVDTVIVDQKQLNIFYRITSKTYTSFDYRSKIYASDGSPLKNSFYSSGGNPKNGEIQTATLVFPGKETMPQQIQFSLKIECANTEDSSGWDSKWDSLDPEKYTFVFDLSLNEASIQRGERYEINEWVTLNQQRIYIECSEIYPAHIRIYLQDDE